MHRRYSAIAGAVLLVGSLVCGGVATLLEGRVPLVPAALGCLGAGSALLVGDLLIRRLSGQRRFWSRYFGRDASLSLRGVLPLWLLGLTLVVAALSFPSP